jgi:hypothetical protein
MLLTQHVAHIPAMPPRAKFLSLKAKVGAACTLFWVWEVIIVFFIINIGVL